MSTKITLKKSGELGNVPSPTELEFGELAINYADGVLYYKDSSNNIQQISGVTSNTFETINANGTLIIADSNNDILTINPGTAIDISGDGLTDTITINVQTNDTFTSNSITTVATANVVNSVYAFASVANATASAAFDAANSAANTVSVSQNSSSTLSAKQLNFVNTANVTILVTDSGDGNANIEFEVAAGSGTLSNIAISSDGVFVANANAFNFINTGSVLVTTEPGVDGNANISFEIAEDGSFINSDIFSGDGACTSFILTNRSSTDTTFVYLDGVSQKPEVDYQVAFQTLSFNVAPYDSASIEVRTITRISPTDISKIQSNQFLGDGACTEFTISGTAISTDSVFVFVDGVTQVPGVDYTLNSDLVIFTNPPENDGVIEIRSISALQLFEYSNNIVEGNTTLKVENSKLEFSSNGFNTPFDSVSRTYLLRGTTTSNNESEIFLSNGTRIPIAANTTVFYTADIVGRRTDEPNESAAYHIKGVADDYDGIVDDVGSLYELVVAEDDVDWLVDARVDSINNSINMYVTGENSKTIRWTALVKTVEVADS